MIDLLQRASMPGTWTWRSTWLCRFQCIPRWKFCQDNNVKLVDEARTYLGIFALPLLTRRI